MIRGLVIIHQAASKKAMCLVSPPFDHGRPTIGVLDGWQIYRTARPLSYLNPIFRGIRQAAADLGCNLLLGCGLGPTAAASDPLRPAWPFPSPETDFVPIGPWNTDGLIAINPLHSEARSRDLHQVKAAGHPVQVISSGEGGPTIVADNAGVSCRAISCCVSLRYRATEVAATIAKSACADWNLTDEGRFRRERPQFQLPATAVAAT